MQSRKDIIREYKERKHTAGVFIIKNTANGRFLLGSSLNIEGPLNKHRFMLQIGSHRNTEMQKDFREFGSEAFVFEILETIEPSDKPGFDIDDELKLLEEIWVEKLQPSGELGYNREQKIREA
ncbi:GIY-YIG nuclease family protein [bacterium]|nr:GIY-YIG nuclease family protein [bacterium]